MFDWPQGYTDVLRELRKSREAFMSRWRTSPATWSERVIPINYSDYYNANPAIQAKILDERIQPTDLVPKTEGSAGVDLAACVSETIILKPNEWVLIPTGVAIHLKDPRYCALLFPRSGTGHKKGLVLGNLVGLIDSDYQGELKVSAWNRTDKEITIEPMERIAQMIITPVVQPKFEIVDEFDNESERGEGGFGSTGTN